MRNREETASTDTPRDLEVGDTIQCKDKENAVDVMIELAKEGIDTDFDYKDDKIYLVITKI